MGRFFWVFLSFSSLVPYQFISGVAKCSSHHCQRFSAFLFSSQCALLLSVCIFTHSCVESCFLGAILNPIIDFQTGNELMNTNFSYSLICNFYCNFLEFTFMKLVLILIIYYYFLYKNPRTVPSIFFVVNGYYEHII